MALYPPIVASSMPAFNINNKKVKIYFTLSDYNSSSEIKQVHVTVRRQNSNVNVLNNSNEIIVKQIQQEEEDQILGRFFVEINDSDIVQKTSTSGEEVSSYGFEADVLYKVQLRFSSISGETTDAAFFTDNIQYFSEWSTVCIIKPINPPVFYVDQFYIEQDQTSSIDQDENVFYSSLADFLIVYKQQNSSEILKTWQLQLYDSEDVLLVDSSPTLVSAYNYTLDSGALVINASLPYELQNQKDYKIVLKIQTRNGYTDSQSYLFSTSFEVVDKINGVLFYQANEEQGYVKLNINIQEPQTNNVVIRRTDIKSNFLKWEDLKYFKTTSEQSKFVYYDFTVESGTIYQYLIQKIDIRGRRGTPVYAQRQSSSESGTEYSEDMPGVMIEPEHAYLLESTGNGDLDGIKQLKLKFDFQISSFKYNVLESKTDTIGSQYPFIKRNGDMYYRSFDCSGTISNFMDDAQLFITDQELFNDETELYEVFRGEIVHYVNQYDYIQERKFRDKVEEFLYNTKPKLYKSTQEGNIFIKLMNVSLTPKNELGRLIYTFSATAYEIAPATIETFNHYGLITTGTYDPNLFVTRDTLGQLTSYTSLTNPTGNVFYADQDIIGTDNPTAANTIARKIKYKQVVNGNEIKSFKVDWLRITVFSQPYLIAKKDGVFVPIDDYKDDTDPYREDVKDPQNILYQMERTHLNNTGQYQIYLGTLFTINGEQIIISPPNNIYQINEVDVIKSVIPAKDTYMNVDYHITYVEQKYKKDNPKNIRVDRTNGQIYGHYSANTDVCANIKYKYRFSQLDFKKYVQGIKSILIDTEPNTRITIKTTADPDGTDLIVNHTGELNIDFTQFADVYITSYIIKDEVDALIFYCASVRRDYY